MEKILSDLIGVLLVVLIFTALFRSNRKAAVFKAERLQRLNDLLKLSTSTFTPIRHLSGGDGRAGFSIDEARQKICLVKIEEGKANAVHQPDQCKIKIFSFEQIISVAMFEDGNSVSFSDDFSIGVPLFGGVVVGGTSVQRALRYVHRLDLRLLVDDTDDPLHDVTFISEKTGRDSQEYAAALQSARQWCGIIEIMMKRSKEGK
ncbi:MAG: hypothetical protein HQM06_16620 [Magnetococcales bacterium]|nr:hypothetical protein [Magnetococcales bacterium]